MKNSQKDPEANSEAIFVHGLNCSNLQLQMNDMIIILSFCSLLKYFTKKCTFTTVLYKDHFLILFKLKLLQLIF